MTADFFSSPNMSLKKKGITLKLFVKLWISALNIELNMNIQYKYWIIGKNCCENIHFQMLLL